MFQIKMSKGGSTLLTESPTVAIHFPGTGAFEEALDYAASLESLPCDTITVFPDAFCDPQCEEISVPGTEFAVRRETNASPIAVIVSDIVDEQISPLPGVNYQFVYAEDEVRILSYGQKLVTL